MKESDLLAGSPDRARYGQRNLDVSLDGGLLVAVFGATGGMSRTDAPSKEGAATASTSETEKGNARSVARYPRARAALQLKPDWRLAGTAMPIRGTKAAHQQFAKRRRGR
ncbi:hypothetical protein R3P38DRAFT_2796744 [Favolaschia claudopus]|uniref:Uncharacterized protein n=1 Tax=Favolaschia claudopus TaxID=2862362 RepID=A0AAW0A5V4_9AGAR